MIRNASGIQEMLFTSTNHQMAANSRNAAAMHAVQPNRAHFFCGMARSRCAKNTGGRLMAKRFSSGNHPRKAADPPMESRTAGMTTLSILKIQPVRNTM